MFRSSVLMALAVVVCAASRHPWMNTKDSPEDRAQKLLSQMTLEEKVLMLHGSPTPYVGGVPANTRLGIPQLNLNDGPQGFRPDKTAQPGTSTAWPCGLAIGASFDPTVAFEWGAAQGREFAAKGSNVQLGPGICVARVPNNGRNFEYISGEDPVLGASLVGHAIQGIQSSGVIANAKHWVNNNQETDRTTVDEIVDDRTRWEIYYPPFQAAVDAGVGSFMCSYNKINGFWSCENNGTLATDLKARMGFKGWVMSDWGATHSLSIGQGLDQQMPDASFFGQNLLDAVKKGTVSQGSVDESVLRILTPMFSVGLFEPGSPSAAGNLTHNVSSVDHSALARSIAVNSTILLKNANNLLPLSRGLKSIALIGNEVLYPTIAGGGSGHVPPSYVVSVADAMTNAVGADKVTVADGKDVDAAVKAASNSQFAIVNVAVWSSEGSDRRNLSLRYGDDDLIRAVAKANPNTIVIVHSVGAVLMPWVEDVPAILLAFMPGQQVGNAMTDLLFGDANPCARLPLTMPNVENEIGFTPAQWPGINLTATYSEKLRIGYRWYDDNKVVPRFAFGHGLSYATFEYSNLVVSSTNVAIDITNTATVRGAEIVQLYVGFPSSAGEPPQQLKDHQKIYLNPNEKATVNFVLTDRTKSIYDVQKGDFAVVSGQFNVYVGASSRDIRQTGSFTV